MWRETDTNKSIVDANNAISIHSLRVEGDDSIPIDGLAEATFQSTPSVWRETHSNVVIKMRFCHFNPLPPCGGRQTTRWSGQIPLQFQSTPSVWRETFGRGYQSGTHGNFNPLPPCGGRLNINRLFSSMVISIHSLRVEGDQFG